jgi:TetR/AcrR family transcriptional regulator, transcriptional repressor for nem operon
MSRSHTAPAASARDRLLDAAVRIVREKGFSATSVDDLCRAAGVTKGAFFHHFPSKEALGVAAAAHFGARAAALMDMLAQHPQAGPADRVLAYIALRRAIIGEDFADFTCFLGTTVQEAYATSPAIREACGAEISGHALAIAADLRSALDAAGRTGIDAEDLALHVQAVIQGGFVVAKALRDPDRARRSLDHLARYLRMLFDPTRKEAAP